MDIQTFINNYYEAFSLKAESPIAFWYSDSLLGELKQTQGCLFKALPAIRQGEIIRYLHFARIDRLTSFEKVEGLLFLATPDILSGLITWTFFDNNIRMPSPHHLVPVAAPPSRSLSTKIDKEVTARSLVSSIPRSDHMWKATY
jgi:hypothetical protein